MTLPPLNQSRTPLEAYRNSMLEKLLSQMGTCSQIKRELEDVSFWIITGVVILWIFLIRDTLLFLFRSIRWIVRRYRTRPATRPQREELDDFVERPRVYPLKTQSKNRLSHQSSIDNDSWYK